MPRLSILFVVSECVPFAKTGGLADVAGSLPIALAARGHDVRIVLPRYRVTKRHPATQLPAPLAVPIGFGEAWAGVYEARLAPGSAVKVYLLEHDAMFDRDGIYNDKNGDFGDNLARFTFLSRGALRLCDYLDFKPDVVHVHDWPTSLVPIYLDTVEARSFGQTASVLTIHNMAYQGWFSKHDLYQTGLGWDVFHARGLEAYDSINLLKGGIYHSTLVTTVSPRYAREIQSPEGGERLDGALRDRGGSVLGILNGIDEAIWSPATDKHLATTYSPDDLRGKAACKAALQEEFGLPQRPDVPLIGVVSRLVTQKGIDLIAEAVPQILSLGAQLVVLGAGESWAERYFSRLAATSPQVGAFVGLNEALAHRIEAGADLFLMPSRYEPCGLNQLYSQRYGTLPIVRAVGGLDDTVENEVTGFKFDELSADALAQTVAWAIFLYRHQPEKFREMQIRSMRKPMGWGHASRQYEALYRMAIARRRR
ncbi:MAG: glycogen synthase GlgA [Byssovorax sp.]